MVRLSPERIKALQKLLKEQFNLDYSDEQAQQAGIATMRFVVAKSHHNQKIQKELKSRNGKTKS